jgi:hypothetical protein
MGVVGLQPHDAPLLRAPAMILMGEALAGRPSASG